MIINNLKISCYLIMECSLFISNFKRMIRKFNQVHKSVLLDLYKNYVTIQRFKADVWIGRCCLLSKHDDGCYWLALFY